MPTSRTSTLALALCLLLWIGFFVLGSAVPSDNLLKHVLNESNPPLNRTANLLGFVFTWTWSNILWLCCFASLVGEYGRGTMGHTTTLPSPTAAMVRGFFIFLAMATGQLVIVGTISLPPSLIENAGSALDPSIVSPGQYFRIATFCSFLSFFVGFKPSVFTSFLSRVERFAAEEKVG
ncbi:MAG: hypothetical protein R2834_24555 [Rhodothermales bacterium]